MIHLEVTKRTDKRLLERMLVHYSNPKGFVGRNICYAIYYDNKYYGHIVGGSSTRFLKGRNEFFNISINQLNNIVNNIFYSVSKVNLSYPIRNFTTAIVKEFIKRITIDWEEKYGDKVLGIETLVEKPRTGELYKKAGFTLVGETKGFSCKRIAGIGTDSYTGRRIWDTKNLKPKLVYCYKIEDKDNARMEREQSDS